MNENEGTGARGWFVKADTDFKSARLLTNLSGPPETICFLAQRGAEKYLKGYLVWHGVAFRKVHDLLEILNGCRSVDEAFGELAEDCQSLNPFAVEVRYPGFGVSYSGTDAYDALERAECIRCFVREQLGLSEEAKSTLEESNDRD